MEGRAELVFTDWAQWQKYQRVNPRWKKIHHPLDLAVRWGVTKQAVYVAISRGAIPVARVTGPLGEKRLCVPEYAVLEYEKSNLGRTRPSASCA